VDVVAERPERPLRVGVDGDLAARALQPVLENACRYARSHVSIAIAADDGRVAFHVRDDGPGLGEGEPSVVFDPGVRGAAAAATPGAGLGLALARRIARSITGDVTARAGAGGDFTVSLPRA
jgi:signal transduction histidine kinase